MTDLIDGNRLLARSLRALGVDTLFFIMGGPMMDAEAECGRAGIRLVDVRHEQAAAMMATGFARTRRTVGVCMACSGPGVANLASGIANAWADGSPVLAIGGASPVRLNDTLAFQEVDQVAMFRPITKWAARVHDTDRIPEYVERAVRVARSGQPGPVYLDIPGDVLYRRVAADAVRAVGPPRDPARSPADPDEVVRAADVLARARRPVVISGSGVLWSGAEVALRSFVETTGIPFFATPQGRGAVPERHELSFLGARGAAFRECDAIVQVGTRQNYVVSHLTGNRWNPSAPLIQIDVDPLELSRNRAATVELLGDARTVLEQLTTAAAGLDRSAYDEWRSRLRTTSRARMERTEELMTSDAKPIHPLRLCGAVRDALPPDAVLVVDGQEILNFARQSIPFDRPHSLNSGPFGMMGVGLPLAIGAKVADPDRPVVVLHGDGSFGMNGMELDTAVRHGVPVVCVISNNGGWTASDTAKPGRDLGFTRYDRMFAPLGLHTAHVEDPRDLAPALRAALDAGRPALVNVVTDPLARASYAAFTDYST